MAKAGDLAALTAAMTVSMIAPAQAYLDPGTGSILLQAIIGGIAATLFVARGYIYRFKGWLGLIPHRADDKRQAGKQ